MKIANLFIILFISLFLTWAVYDRNLFLRRRETHLYNEAEFSIEIGTNSFYQNKKIQQQRLNVIPPKYRKLKKPVRKKCNYFSTKSRDARNSDQKKIRRRFNNM